MTRSRPPMCRRCCPIRPAPGPARRCPTIDRAAYDAAFDRVKAYIAAGDIYQANLTFPADVPVAGDPLALYARIRARAAAGWGGIVADGTRVLLSFSPELFFRLDGRRIEARPMKGTATRGADPAADAAAARELATDPKQRAENLMIVDLIRNDLSRDRGAGQRRGAGAVRGRDLSHHPPDDLHRHRRARPGRRCGRACWRRPSPADRSPARPSCARWRSPPRSSRAPRGLYTGSIGRIDADGDGGVQRRDPHAGDGAGASDRATLGLGSGVVADSEASAEWRECLAKGGFVDGRLPAVRSDRDDGVRSASTASSTSSAISRG